MTGRHPELDSGSQERFRVKPGMTISRTATTMPGMTKVVILNLIQDLPRFHVKIILP
jgi:hypothetical protein